jgi:hypothetical protein
MPLSATELHAFDRKMLSSILGYDQDASIGVKYITKYLEELEVKSFILEKHYIDRHFLEDYQEYYSRSFEPPASHCQRLHFFSCVVNELDKMLTDAFSDPNRRVEIEKQLSECYLGFCVIRPLLSARIGRSVLRTYESAGIRRYEVVRPYLVSIAGLSLAISGLAFQQQDQGAAVCASTALWSALQRVAYVMGRRTPTPSMITNSAHSPLPASYGLSDDQMAFALATLGYTADYFIPYENLALFKVKIAICLESQLPVILLISCQQMTGCGIVPVGHAVTVTGFRAETSVIDVPAPADKIAPINMRQGSLSVVYVHDDNLGCHAHYELFETEDTESKKMVLKLRRGRSDGRNPSWWPVDEWNVCAALVPKPDKMRLPIEQLFFSVIEIRELIKIVFPTEEISYSTRFTSGVEYKRSLTNLSFEAGTLREFLFAFTLPRYVGIINIIYHDEPICDVVLDVTEVKQGIKTILGITTSKIPVNSIAGANLQKLSRFYDIPILINPSSFCFTSTC